MRFRLSAFLTPTLLLTTSSVAAPFSNATAQWLGPTPTEGWSNKVELCDLDADGDLDALVANGAAYNEADVPEAAYFWRNEGDHFDDASADLPVEEGWWRVVKCADVDGDGDSDAFFGGTFQSQSVLVLNDGGSLKRSDTVPAELLSLGDAEFADVDGDADLDLVVADWGTGDPFVVRGRPRLWINDGAGSFVDETEARLPGARTGFSWDLEAVDVDDDLDLDLLVSCKVCADGGLLLQNDGDGVFLDQSAFLPGEGNNYEFEPLDVDGDGDLDLFTVNDGKNLAERLLINDGGVFTASDDSFARGVVTEDDDNAVTAFDVDGDGDEDVLIGSLSGDDRVFINDGGVFTDLVVATDSNDTPGSLGIAVGDLDGDGKVDLVMSQGEQAFDDAVYLGDEVADDDAAPVVGVVGVDAKHSRVVVRAHDHLSPVRDGDVVVTATFHGAGAARTAAMTRAGEQQWQARITAADVDVVVCAKDRGGREACSARVVLVRDDEGGDGDVVLSGGGCVGSAAFAFPLLLVLRRRRQR